MDQIKVKTIIQEAINQELKEIFGFGRKSTEKLEPDPTSEFQPPEEKFSFATLKSLKSSKDIRAYVRRTLNLLGTPGQAREAYELDSNKILKLAKSDNKVYQNKNEVQNAKCIGPSYAIKVYDFDSNYTWIIEERVQPLSRQAFMEKLNSLMNIQGTNFEFTSPLRIQDFFANMQKLLGNRSDDPRFQDLHNLLMKQNKWYVGLLEKLQHCNVASWDFHRENWGLRPSTGELVLLDIGFNPTEQSPEDQFFKEEFNPISFSLDDVKKLKNNEEILEYCWNTLGKPLGKGSGRMVWAIDNEQIIKVARYQPSKQNEKEFENSLCLGKQFAVEVLDYDIQGFKWLIEEKVKGFENEKTFAEYMNKILGTSSLDMFDIADIFADSYHTRNIRKELIQNNDWFRSIIKALNHCIVATYDFHDENWGIRPSTGELVLLDLGF